METTRIILLFSFIFIHGIVAKDPTPVTSKSVGDDKDISMNTETRFVIDGNKLEVECKMKYKNGKRPTLKFMNDTDATELKSTDRLKIEIKDQLDPVKGNFTIGKIVWNPIYVADNIVKVIRCRNEDSSKSKQFRLEVLPASRIPTIKIKEGSSIELEKKINQHKLVCFVTCKECKTGEDFEAQWRLDIDTRKLPEKMSQQYEKINSTTGISTLTINDTSLVDKKKLSCVAVLKLNKDFEAVKIVKEDISVAVVGDPAEKRFSKEIEVRTDDDVKLDCFEAVGEVSGKVKWFKQDEYKGESTAVELSDNDLKDISSRYTYEKSKKGKNSAANSVISIVTASFEDRSQFVCKAEFPDKIAVTTITLRVRDPLGAVWPLIGILIEAIVMVVIIWYTEFARKREEKKKSAGTSFAMDEKAHNDTTDNAPLMKSNTDGSTTA